MTKKYNSLFIFGAIETVLLLIDFYFIPTNSPLSFSVVTALFFIAAPVLYYFLSRKEETEFTFWFVFYLAFKTTPYLFPMKGNFFKIIFDWKIYFNIAFLLFLVWTAVHFILNFRKTIKQNNTDNQDDYSIIMDALQKSIKFKKLGKIIAFEICSFYYCFIKWSANKSSENQYTGYKNSGVSAIYIGLMLASVAEAVTVHVILISWSKTATILFLILHSYLLINLTGQLKAIIFRKHLVTDDKIIIRYGLFNSLEIPISLIEKISKFEGDYEKSNTVVKFALLGKLEPHNVAIECKNDIEVSLPFGIVKKPKQLLLYIDDVNLFITNVESSKS
ncbi:hypothetical protein SAMN05444397_101521 [Flavobacterium aquidurense]|uniref:RDD family protein n=1 Tax=Flavobacterium frigidimaris TaxID=262320 RepID=A0ABX4BK61_FLAFR|nr:hypothetical protein [Flavobacterium frigidimaris]OXA75438.1 hypothetical protein B0A65_22145 [Flavobacterium frigidimaris]SDY38831.1 hypothetical protein SAMN05444397_101521 [Flavobacterium aquidurense]